MNAFDIIEREIRKYPKTVIIGHIQPDGDCIGSSLGLKYLIKDNWGVEATVINQKIDRLSFLGCWDEAGSAAYENTFVIQVDNSTRERSADPAFIKAPAILKIDHHIVMDSYGNWNIEEQLSSCCQIIASHAIEKGLKISKQAAAALYTGMVTDTGRFSYTGVDGKTLAVASRLLETGFDMPAIISLLSRRDMNSVEYTKYCYENMKISKGGVVWLYVKQEIIDRFGLTPDKVSSALDTLRDIEGHPVFVLFADLEGKIRVEFRSDRIRIVDAAVKFGGGGHECACGARLESAQQIPAVIEELEKYVPSRRSDAEKSVWMRKS